MRYRAGGRGPSADQILDKYIQAVGGAQALAKLTSFVAKGTYGGYDTDLEALPLDVFAKAPNQRSAIVHMHAGDSITTFDGSAGWVASPDKPVALITLAGESDGGSRAAFQPGSQVSPDGAGFPPATINERAVLIVQGTAAGFSQTFSQASRSAGASAATDTAVKSLRRRTTRLS